MEGIMRAEAQGLSYLKRDRRYDVPFFQRRYVWDKDNWEEFYDSLLDGIRTNKAAFLGSIIIKDTERKVWDKSVFNIIDGQQRLTTISLFIKAFIDEKVMITDRSFQDCLDTLFIYENHSSTNHQLKIHHSKLDKEEFEKCLSSIYTNNYLTINNSSKIFQCYKYFRQRLSNLNIQETIKVKELVLDSENELYKIFVLIEIDSKENEQKIFDTINSSGVKLTSADIIKNAIFDRIMQNTSNSNDVVDFYNDTWEKTFLIDDSNVKYWERETVSGRIKRERIEVLLHSVAIIKQIYDPQQHTIEDLPEQYKQYIANKSLDELKQLVNDICEFATLYKNKFIEFDDDPGHAFSLDQREELFHKIIDLFDTSTFDPYILNLYYKNKNNQLSNHELNLNLLKLEKYIARTLICGSDNKKNFNKNNSELINSSNVTIDTLLSRNDISDLAFKNALKRVSNNQYGKIILYMIELKRLQDNRGMAGTSTLQFTFSLEHVMPQSYHSKWNLNHLPLNRKDSNGNDLTLEQLNNYRYNSIYEIGNMTLLRQKLNSTISNESFNVKKNGNLRFRGINSFPQLSICTEITSKNVWNEDEIESRTRNLTTELFTIW